MRYVKRVIRRSGGNVGITLDEAFREFMVEKEAKGLVPVSLHGYDSCYKVFKRFNGFTELTTTDEIAAIHIQLWVKDMQHNGAKTATINSYLSYSRAFLYWCMDEERGYMQPFKIPMVKGQEESIKLYTDDELLALLRKPSKEDNFAEWRTWAIVNWALATGNRASTICAVKIGDVDYIHKEITLRHTKNKKAQTIPLSPALEIALREYIRMWRRYAKAEAWLFPNVGEEQLTYSALIQKYRRYCARRGVNKANIHGLRHNFAKGWIMNGGNVFALQKVLGHSNLNMTRRYVKLFAEDIKEDYNVYSTLDAMKRSSSRTQLVKRI